MTKRSVFMYHEDCCKINPYSNGPKKKKEITWQGSPPLACIRAPETVWMELFTVQSSKEYPVSMDTFTSVLSAV